MVRFCIRYTRKVCPLVVHQFFLNLGALAWQSTDDHGSPRCRVVGIASLGFEPCDDTSIPSIFAKVASKPALEWIHENMKSRFGTLGEIIDNALECVEICDPGTATFTTPVCLHR